MSMMLPLLAFVFGSALVAAAAIALMPSRAGAIDRRVEELTFGGRDTDVEEQPRMQSFVAMLKRVGERAPKSPKEMGNLRLRLVQAGYRREEALTIFFGSRVAFALGLFFLLSTGVLIKTNMIVALGGLGLGYILPGMLLARMAKRRSHRIRWSPRFARGSASSQRFSSRPTLWPRTLRPRIASSPQPETTACSAAASRVEACRSPRR